jgi:hypothetical protein
MRVVATNYFYRYTPQLTANRPLRRTLLLEATKRPGGAPSLADANNECRPRSVSFLCAYAQPRARQKRGLP